MINFLIEHWFGVLVTILYFGFVGWVTYAIHEPDKPKKCKK